MTFSTLLIPVSSSAGAERAAVAMAFVRPTRSFYSRDCKGHALCKVTQPRAALGKHACISQHVLRDAGCILDATRSSQKAGDLEL